MQTDEHDRFWRMYDRRARPAIERACRAFSRSLTDNRMDPDEMIAWADERVWRLLEKGGWPTFHDDPTPEAAVERLTRNAKTVARWAYLALSRKHWRRRAREQAYFSRLSRAERLAVVSARDETARREEVESELARLRGSIGKRVRQRLAASWSETDEKHRIAMAIGATDEEDEALIDQVIDGEIKPNTVQQMRSRSLRRARSVFQGGRGASALILAAAASLLASPGVAMAGEEDGGERTGGRQTLAAAHGPASPLVSEGERTGGRKGSMDTGLIAGRSDLISGGERTGGRDGK